MGELLFFSLSQMYGKLILSLNVAHFPHRLLWWDHYGSSCHFKALVLTELHFILCVWLLISWMDKGDLWFSSGNINVQANVLPEVSMNICTSIYKITCLVRIYIDLAIERYIFLLSS